MKHAHIKKISALVALSVLGLFLLFSNWLSAKDAIFLAIEIPFLYFVPGFLITRILFRSGLDKIETIALSTLFSLILSHIGIYTLEEATQRMTIVDIARVVAVINILCALAYLARRKQLSPARLYARLRGKLHKSDQK